MKVRMAAKIDIEQLIKARFDYFAAEKWDVPGETAKSIENQLRDYFSKHLGADFVAAIAETENEIASVAFMSITERPASIFIPTGRFGCVQNVLTYPEHRRKGCATKTLGLLSEEGKKYNLSYIELTASEMGKPLYEKLGFKEHTNPLLGYTAMRFKII